MASYDNIYLKSIPRRRYDEVREFLKQNELRLDDTVEYVIGAYDDDRLVATCALDDTVLKSIAVAEDYKGFDLSARVITEAVKLAFDLGRHHLFIFTKTTNSEIFSGLGFYEIARVEGKAMLMENRKNGIKSYCDELASHKVEGKRIGGLVVNCNPFTLGHQYLVEYAASQCDHLHIFVVYENRSTFPNNIRYQLVCEGTSHLKNVTVHKATGYIISAATFPSYFIKDLSSVTAIHCQMDVTIFGRYIVPALGLNARYVGHEPFDPTTALYNETMKQILPTYGVEVVEVPRKELDGTAISASEVRRRLRTGSVEDVKELVPATTYNFLLTEEGTKIIEKIREKETRH